MTKEVLGFICLSVLLNPVFATDQDTTAISGSLKINDVSVIAQKAEISSNAYRLITQISHDEIAALPIQTISDILTYLPGVDVRTRGANGAQADVSMHGGTFDQVLVMINGVNLTDSQTGHYSLNLPISTDIIERIEVLQGTPADLFGLNAFSGAINIVTRSDRSGTSMRMTGGMNALLNPSITYRTHKNNWYLNTAAEYNSANGYYAPSPSEKEATALSNSDYRIANIYLQTGCKDWDIQLGSQYKDAGAGMFYGFGSQDQYDATRTAFGSVKYQHSFNNRWSIEAQAAYRANYDRYEWHRGQRLYGNFHLSQNAALSIKAHYNSSIGKTSFGVEARDENIHSTNLGDTINPNGQVPNVEGFNLKDLDVFNLVKGKNRININYFGQQAFYWNNFSASVGVSGNWNDMYGHNFAGGANFGYQYAPQSNVYINIDRSLRLPTFTDLYYNAGNQLGNIDLKPEQALSVSVGTKYQHQFNNAGTIFVQADAYYRWGNDIIDWVYTPSDTKRPFHAQNWNKVNSTGIDFTFEYRLNEWLRQCQLSYGYTYLDLDVDKSGSRYLDYLKHKIVFKIDHSIWRSNRSDASIGACWAVSWYQREGQYNNAEGEVCNYNPFMLLDARLYWQKKFVKVSLDCTNITNQHYYDLGGILQPGAWFKFTLSVKL